MKWQDVLPVVLSVIVLIVVAIVERHSRLVAAITAVMPLGAPLALWIVYSANGGDRTIVTEFNRGMLLGVLPTLGFIVAVWVCARLGMKLMPMLAVGYAVWAIGVGVLALLRKLTGL